MFSDFYILRSMTFLLNTKFLNTHCLDCSLQYLFNNYARFYNVSALSTKKIRVRLKGYDHQLVDQSAKKIVDVVERTGGLVSGPVPLPTVRKVITILRAVHKYKDSREQFETRTHKRVIDVVNPSNKTIDALSSLDIPAGVEVEVKV